MNFQRHLNTHKPETMMVFKKVATRQAKQARPSENPTEAELGRQPRRSFWAHAIRWFKWRQNPEDRRCHKVPLEPTWFKPLWLKSRTQDSGQRPTAAAASDDTVKLFIIQKGKLRSRGFVTDPPYFLLLLQELTLSLKFHSRFVSYHLTAGTWGMNRQCDLTGQPNWARRQAH